MRARSPGLTSNGRARFLRVILMPGTNGLRSVNAVKTNPKTAMYKLVSRLSLVWFAGAARIGVHSGQCCLTRNQFGSYDISAPSAPINSCEISGGAYGV